jgi:CHASE3 domain sensor protein
MEADERTHELLKEILASQREYLAEYRSVTREALELQRLTVDRQERVRHAYVRVVLVGGVLVAPLLVLLCYLLVRWSHYLFR